MATPPLPPPFRWQLRSLLHLLLFAPTLARHVGKQWPSSPPPFSLSQRCRHLPPPPPLPPPHHTQPHIQLATAKLPADVDVDFFNTQMYQWAATLTQAGRNLPFALPQRVDRLPNGFQVRARAGPLAG